MQNIKNRLAQNPRLWLLIATGAGLAVALPVRIWQQLFLVEDFTGFWFNASHPSIIVLYVFLALPLVASLAIALLTNKTVIVDLSRQTRKAEGYVCLVAALCMVISAVLALLQVFAARSAGAGFDASLLAGIMEGIFGLGVVVFFVNLGLVNLFPISNVYLIRMLTLMPLLWSIARLLGHFSRTISYLRVSDLFLNIMSMVLLLLFFMAAAQIISGVNAEKKMWRLTAVGLPAALFLLLVFLPRLVAFPFFTNIYPSQDSMLNLADLGMAAFVGVFMITRICAKPEESLAQTQHTAPEAETETYSTQESLAETGTTEDPTEEPAVVATDATPSEEQVSIEEI